MHLRSGTVNVMAAAAGLGSRRGRSRQPGSRRRRGQLQEPVVLDILDAGGLLPRLVADGYLPRRDRKDAA